MGQRLILSEEEKRNIQEMYGLINEQNTEPRGIYFGGEYFVNDCKTEDEKNKELTEGINKIKSYKDMVEIDKLPLDASQRVNCIWMPGFMTVFTDIDFKPESFVGVVAVDGSPAGYKANPFNRDNRVSRGYAELHFIFKDGKADKYSFPDLGLDVNKCKYFVKDKKEN